MVITLLPSETDINCTVSHKAEIDEHCVVVEDANLFCIQEFFVAGKPGKESFRA
jgi:hypothetical protein